MQNKNKKVEPSFIQLIKWAIGAVLFMFLSTLAYKHDFKIISITNIICSIWCAFIAITEAYLIHVGQGAIDNLNKE